MQPRLISVLVITATAVPSLVSAGSPRPTPVYGYRIVHVYPHDRTAFTQGLEYRGGFLYEGTGLNGESTLRQVELESGKILKSIRLDSHYFGEGITVLDQRVVELTWQSHRGFVYDRDSFQTVRNFDYPGEGWGLTNDGRQIFMSDGSAEIRCWDPATLQEIRRFTVHDGQTPIQSLNELEYVRGEIYANVWLTDRIARISPTDGQVTGWIDLSGLLSASDLAAGANVLNGIAYDSLGDRLFVTGKLWPKLFEIQLVRKS
ncbi:MAG: glutaminyl-peptide cyclotransferase [Bryobacteraceae bacterium]|jgi:glutaminyl-peptide cyclotransferase